MKKLLKALLYVILTAGITSCAELQQASRTVANSGVLNAPAGSAGTARKTVGSGVTNTNKINTGIYYIINVGSQKALTLPKKEKFVKVRLSDFDGSDLQKWEIVQSKNGTIQLKVYDSPNWHLYFSNSVWLSVNSEDKESFTLRPAAGTSNKFHFVTSTYGSKVLIWDGDPSYNGTQTAVLKNNKFDQWELVPAR